MASHGSGQFGGHLAAMALVVAALIGARSAAADVVMLSDPAANCGSDLMKGIWAVRGLDGPVYLAGGNGYADGDRLTIKHNAGLSLFSKCEKDWVPESIAQLKLLGQTIRITVDLSKVGCACNLAFYLISAPAHGWDGQYSPGGNRDGQPPYYCDANQVGGQWCPEVDIMEANNHAFATTPHKCDWPKNGHYSNCDRGGCGQNTKDRQNAYCPGEWCTIDTRRPFVLETEFPEEGGHLVGMRATLKQGDRSLTLGHEGCDRQYMASLTDAMRAGMSLRVTYWGDTAQTMAWMDRPACGWESCDQSAGEAVISNMSVYPIGAPPQPATAAAPPPPPPAAPLAAEPAEQVPDVAAPWVCHDYASPNSQEWCDNGGIHDGYEYANNNGQAQPCDGCWCCKRRAVSAPEVIWVITDDRDPLVGQQVPHSVMMDASLSAQIADLGIVQWQGGAHFVKRRAAGGACGGAPCAVSLQGEASVLMRKSEVLASPPDLAFGGRALWLPAACAGAALAVALAGVAAAVVRHRRRRLKAAAEAENAREAAGAQSPSGGADPEAPANSPGGLGGSTPMLRRKRSSLAFAASPTATPHMRRSGSSCQKLLSFLPPEIQEIQM